jgi:two-component system cell cycle response regulator
MTDKKKTILIVEDSPVQALSASQLLEDKGLNTICAVNGEAGLDMARQNLPDAILLDIQMPGMDGLEVCRRLQADPKTSGIPIILLTSQDNPETLRRGFDGGAVDFIPKDAFYGTILIETLRQLEIINQ